MERVFFYKSFGTSIIYSLVSPPSLRTQYNYIVIKFLTHLTLTIAKTVQTQF